MKRMSDGELLFEKGELVRTLEILRLISDAEAKGKTLHEVKELIEAMLTADA